LQSRKYLSIYLNDHLAALTTVRDVARRCRRSNEGTDLGDFLEEVIADLDRAIAELESLAVRLGVRRDPLKRVAAWAAEKIGRLKLNGHLLSYSPLSRVLEIEGLIAGTDIELSTWRALEAIVERDPIESVDACTRRREALGRHHAEAVAVALGGR
jgi:hypothetical protein